MAASAFLTLLLSASTTCGQHQSHTAARLRSILEAHAGPSGGDLVKSTWLDYVNGLTQAAGDGAVDSMGEVPTDEEPVFSDEARTINQELVNAPPALLADDGIAGSEAEVRWLQADYSTNSTNVTAAATTLAETTTVETTTDGATPAETTTGETAEATTAETTTAATTAAETTTAATTTAAETTTAPPEGVVLVSLTVVGIDYNRLVANTTALENFIYVSREALALAFDVPIALVSVNVSPGSVRVEAIVRPPEGKEAHELLQDARETELKSAVMQYIEEADTADRIGYAKTGDIEVPSVGTRIIEAPVTTTGVETTLAASAANTCTCRDGTAATGASCIADNNEQCAQCNDGFELNDVGECKVTAGARTHGSSGCVYRFVGGGYCHPNGRKGELRLRINDWLPGNRRAAEAACCDNPRCAGFHLDTSVPDFVMLHDVGSFEDTWERRECWQKVTQDGEDGEDVTDGAPPRLLPLLAVVAVALLHMTRA